MKKKILVVGSVVRERHIELTRDAHALGLERRGGCALAERAMLGDMVISMERCAEQAETYGHSFAHEVSYLTVHSVLHLLGYDHVDEGEDKRRMRAREKEIMRLLDV